MRRHVAVTVLIVAGLFIEVEVAEAQSAMLKLPRASQHARMTQRIGITDITLDYSRPLVGDRKIFGGLLAYGKVWRAGANENTVIEFSDPVTIEGQALPKGAYGLHFIPDAASWIVIFSGNSSSWGSFDYDAAEDALRVTVKPQTIEEHEALSYDFDNPKPDSVVITMRWERVAVPINVAVNTPDIVEQSLHNQLRGRVQFEWQAWQEAANYLLNNKLSAEEAAKDADQSIGIEDRFENEIVKARALSALGRKDEALATQKKALAMGSQQQVYDFGRGLQRQGQINEALEVFRNNIKNDPNSWIAHTEEARLAVAKGDYYDAEKEIKLASTLAPDSLKPQLEDIIRQLENKVDINK